MPEKGSITINDGLNNYLGLAWEIQSNTKYQEKELLNWAIVKLFVNT